MVQLYAKIPSAYALDIPLVTESIPDMTKKTLISGLIQKMLAVDPGKRPRAGWLSEAFKLDIQMETTLAKATSAPSTIVRGERHSLLNIDFHKVNANMRHIETLGAYGDPSAGGVNQRIENEAIVQGRGGFPLELDSRLISSEIIVVNMANTHIATVRSTNIEGNLIRIQELRETKSGAILWRHEQPYLQTARHAFPGFSPEGQYGGFLCGKSIVLVDTRSPDILTKIDLPDKLFDVLSFAIGPGARRLAVSVHRYGSKTTFLKHTMMGRPLDVFHVPDEHKSPCMYYTPDGSHLFLTWDSGWAGLHVKPEKRFLIVKSFNINSTEPESRDVKMDKVSKYTYTRLGTITIRNEDCILIDVHFAIPDRGPMGFIMRGERKVDRSVIAISPTGKKYTIYEFQDDNGQEIIMSQGKVMVFEKNGEVKTSDGKKGRLHKTNFEAARIIAFCPPDRAILLSEAGDFQFDTISLDPV